jgi:1-acyl-sn-glycerol-3-phosphate acyltransferase
MSNVADLAGTLDEWTLVEAQLAEIQQIEAQLEASLDDPNTLTHDCPGEDEQELPAAWNVKKRIKTGVVKEMKMLLPTVARVATNILGGTLATSGYVVGKAGEAVGLGKATDSLAFQTAFKAWMHLNGIFPTVQYETLSSQASESSMSLTPIIVANHVSYLDGMILAALFGAPKIVAKAEARNTPIMGKLLEEMETVFVDRGSENSRQTTLNAIEEHCRAWVEGSRPLLIFPEGTTTNGESPLQFKKGAFAPGVPVRPVLLVYTGHWDPSNTSHRETASGIEETSDGEWAKEFLGNFLHQLHVRVLPAYIPSDSEAANPELYAQNCHDYMSRELARVKVELHNNSWKEVSGRTHGGLGYKFGDVTRMVVRKLTR